MLEPICIETKEASKLSLWSLPYDYHIHQTLMFACPYSRYFAYYGVLLYSVITLELFFLFNLVSWAFLPRSLSSNSLPLHHNNCLKPGDPDQATMVVGSPVGQLSNSPSYKSMYISGVWTNPQLVSLHLQLQRHYLSAFFQRWAALPLFSHQIPASRWIVLLLVRPLPPHVEFYQDSTIHWIPTTPCWISTFSNHIGAPLLHVDLLALILTRGLCFHWILLPSDASTVSWDSR